jgi:hypothetical protein
VTYEHPGQEDKSPEKQAGNSPGTIPEPRIISYNLREGERPGGMKVRYKAKIETGRKARELDERQAEMIRELLEWARQRRAGPGRKGTR